MDWANRVRGDVRDDTASGRVNAQETNERYELYMERWGEALPGATMNDGLSDEALLAQMDSVRRQLQAIRRYPPASGRLR